MVRGARKAIAVGVAVAVACGLQKHLNFVPGPRHNAPVAAAAAASMMMAPAALADEIGDAAKKLGDASYSFAKEVDWNNGIFLQAPGAFQPLKALTAIDKMIEMGAAADPKLLKEAAEAHHKAIGSISGPNGVTSRADWDAVNAAIGRVVASVPKAQVMAVYDSVKDITDPGVPAYMKSLVNGPDAEKAYEGFLQFKDVVEKNQVITASAPAVVPSGDKIGEAAKALSDASYPFIKDIDWLSDIYLKPLPGKTAPETLQAIDKMIVMGAKMDGNLLKAAAEAHHKAIGSIDASGVTSAADYEAVNAAIGRLVASVPKSTVMDVYNSMAGIVDSSVTNNMFSKVNPLDAVAAAKGFYTFKDVVEASQRWTLRKCLRTCLGTLFKSCIVTDICNSFFNVSWPGENLSGANEENGEPVGASIRVLQAYMTVGDIPLYHLIICIIFSPTIMDNRISGLVPLNQQNDIPSYPLYHLMEYCWFNGNIVGFHCTINYFNGNMLVPLNPHFCSIHPHHGTIFHARRSSSSYSGDPRFGRCLWVFWGFGGGNAATT